MENSDPTDARSTTWHICWQAAMGRDLLADPSVIDRIRERLLDAHRRQGRILLDYLLTPTEIHLLSRLPPGESPGAIARAVANIVSRWVREAQGVRGPVFAGRYRAHPIESDDALRDEVRLMAWRPVAMGICRTPTHYSHSALRTILGLRRAMGFDARAVLGAFGDSVPGARTALRAWLARRPEGMETMRWELCHGLVLAVGTVGPVSHMAREVRGAAAALVAAGDPPCIDGALGLLERWVLARLGQREARGLAGLSGAVGARGRALVAILATRLGLCSAASVARHFNRAKATLSEQMAACRRRPADQAIFGTPVTRIVDEAVALAVRPGL
jgi:hypothetical protein